MNEKHTDALDLDKLEELASAATAGPWKKGGGSTVGPISRDDDQSYGMVISVADIYGDNRENDTAWVAAANPEAILQLIAKIRAAEGSASSEAAQTSAAIDEYRELMTGDAEPDALERLRFFCSLAMKGQDWLDVEKFFSDVAAQLADSTEAKRATPSGAVPEHSLLSREVLTIAAKAVEDMAEVWTGFSIRDAETCIKAALGAAPLPQGSLQGTAQGASEALDDAHDAALWRKLQSSVDASPCEYPCLRDDLADWLYKNDE